LPDKPDSSDQLFVHGSALAGFQRLMPFQVRKILLVSSLYDYFMLEEDGRLTELLARTYSEWHLEYVPTISRVTHARQALDILASETYDLVIMVLNMTDMNPFEFGRQVRAIAAGLPVIILAYNTPELKRLLAHADRQAVEQIFVWQGDGNILLGIIQYVEDRRNAASDARLVGILNLLVIEDSIEFYSTYLHVIFAELKKRLLQLLEEGMTFSQRQLQLKARPKVLLATSYEEARQLFTDFKGHLLGIITDTHFPYRGQEDMTAGRQFVKRVRQEMPDLPVLFQSSEPESQKLATQFGCGWLSKNSPTLLADLRRQLDERFGFGELVFHDEKGIEHSRVANLTQLFSTINDLPPSILHGTLASGELERWLRVRTEHQLADALSQAAGTPDDPGVDLSGRIRQLISQHRRLSYRGAVVPYSRHFHEDYAQFSMIGSGSIGGKARGLAFIDRILARFLKPDHFPGIAVAIPRTLVLGTDVFDDFIGLNHLLAPAVEDQPDSHVANLFIKASLPPKIIGDLRNFIHEVRNPLAVRSSSLLEDSLYQPFAGIYATKMLPNDQFGDDIRFLNLVNAVKFVMASTFFQQAKAYIRNTPHRIEDEKMAVIIQDVVGCQYRDRFYPDFSGVARSYNYYPVGSAKPEDGVVNVAVGLGKTVVDGGLSLRFTPAYPRVLPQFNSVREMFENSQKEFYAVATRRAASTAFAEEDQYLVKLEMDQAEQDGVLNSIASTYSRENDAVYDGIIAPGPRIINFAHILKNEVFPLAKILSFLLQISSETMNCPVEIEFAVTLNVPPPQPPLLSVLQVRPLVIHDELVKVDIREEQKNRALCFSDQVLGNGSQLDIRDVVFVKPSVFQAAATPAIAQEVDGLNRRLQEQKIPYLLIGPGRWGTTDPWLGIPVKWGQISAAKVIVEASLEGMNVDPSQGSHFFQNMTSLRIGYFTVAGNRAGNFLDWAWLEAQPVENETAHLRHLKFAKPFSVHIDGRNSQGIVVKPDGQ